MAPPPSAVHLTRLEIASGVLAGTEGAAPQVVPDGRTSARDALEAVVCEALLRPPCVVSFSGGRDSSVVLALAALVARREGLAPPIASTLRFEGVATADEREWQERVVAHVRPEDWRVTEVDDELDCVGPVAGPILRRHGVLWPPNVHLVALHGAVAAGGTVLTGAGGDQLFAPSPFARHDLLLSGRRRPEPRDVRRVAYSLSPRVLRRAAWFREEHVDVPWLTSRARSALRHRLRAEAASEPVRAWRHALWTWRSRALQVGMRSIALVAADHGARAIHPFLDPRFVAAFAHELRRHGTHLDRNDAMTRRFDDLLPRAVLTRATKASFDAVFWHRHAQEFVRSFDGTGVDDELVDVATLRRCWAASSAARVRQMVPLQAAWLSADSARAEPVQERRAGSGD